MLVINVLAGLPGIASKIERAILAIDSNDLACPPKAARDVILQFAILVVQVEVTPAGSLGPPDHFSGFIDITNRLHFEIGGVKGFDDHAATIIAGRLECAGLGGPSQPIA